jgi:L,D-transpeptidase catalytic domain
MISKLFLTRSRSAALAMGLMLGVSSCTTPKPQTAAAPEECECYWKGDGVAGSPKILISLNEQCVRYFKGGQLVGVSPISSGREGYGTTRGTYRVIEKDLHHRSSLYGAFVDRNGNIVQSDVDVRKDSPPPGTRFLGAEMRGFMRINGAIGMHAGYLPGFPASHGCIRLPSHMADIFFRETPHGTPVHIVGHASEAPRRPPVPLAVAPLEAELKPPQKVQAKAKEKEKVLVKKKPKSPGQGGWSLLGKKKPKAPPVRRGQTLYLN